MKTAPKPIILSEHASLKSLPDRFPELRESKYAKVAAKALASKETSEHVRKKSTDGTPGIYRCFQGMTWIFAEEQNYYLLITVIRPGVLSAAHERTMNEKVNEYYAGSDLVKNRKVAPRTSNYRPPKK